MQKKKFCINGNNTYALYMCNALNNVKLCDEYNGDIAQRIELAQTKNESKYGRI